MTFDDPLTALASMQYLMRELSRLIPDDGKMPTKEYQKWYAIVQREYEDRLWSARNYLKAMGKARGIEVEWE